LNLVDQKILRQIVRTEFEKIRAKNPAYSQRAFARRIGLNSGTLSGLFRGTRTLSPSTAHKILAKLPVDLNYRAWISKVIDSQKGLGPKIERTLLDIDRFETIASPLHLNALNVLRTEGARGTAEWVAKRLGVEPAEVSATFERLERAGLVTREGKRFVPTREPLRTPEQFPSHAVRAFHRNTLGEAAEKLESIPMELRDFSAITIPGDPAKLAQVRELVAKFRDQVSFLLGSEPGQEVFKLSVQFYPVTKPGAE
jgi:transcriptional regulator with XRE-family HTH domain